MRRARRSSAGSDRPDLVVIGDGTGGLASALVAAGVGVRVVLVERARLGGDCLWTGCVPSKSLLAAAELAHRIRHADDVGLAASEPVIDFARVMAHVDRSRQAIAPQDSAARLTDTGVEVPPGDARFVNPGAVDVAGRRVRYRKAIIAKGARSLLPPIPGLSEVNPLTSETVWDLTHQPRSLAVLGGGLGLGDVTGAPAFTHLAAHHARVATVNALFATRRRVDDAVVLRVTFTDPEVAAVGGTEPKARRRWENPTIVSFDYAELDRAITDGRPYGFATLIGNPRGHLVGATIAAPGGAESVAQMAAWIAVGAKIDRISQTVHAYPTLSEGPSRAADAHLRARYAGPRTQRLFSWALQLLGHFDHAG